MNIILKNENLSPSLAPTFNSRIIADVSEVTRLGKCVKITSTFCKHFSQGGVDHPPAIVGDKVRLFYKRRQTPRIEKNNPGFLSISAKVRGGVRGFRTCTQIVNFVMPSLTFS